MDETNTEPKQKVVPFAVRQRAIQDYLAGDDLVAVGCRYGVSKSTVHRWIHAAGFQTRSPAVVNPVAPRRRGGLPAKSQDAVRLYLSGVSSVEVGAAFGVTPPTVLAWVRRLGHTPRACGPVPTPPSAARLDAVAMCLSGSPARQVATATGVAPSTVLNWVRLAGVEVRPRGHAQVRRSPHPDAVRRAAVAAYRGGEAAKTIAARFGVSANTILNWVRTAGVPVRVRGRRPADS